MRLFPLYKKKAAKRNDQLKIDQLSTSVSELQAVGRVLRTMEKKWEKGDPTSYRRWLGAFVDFYEGGKEGDLLKDVTRIAKRWKGDQSEIDLSLLAPHVYDNGELCLSPDFKYNPDIVLENGSDILVFELARVSDKLTIIDSDSFNGSNYSRILNEYIAAYQETRDDLYLLSAAQVVFSLKLKSKRVKRRKVNELLSLRKRRLPAAIRDLRQFFRKIIKFLFKNMEADEDSNALFILRIKQALLTVLKFFHEQKEISQKIKLAY